jgi:small subunit ribosomal protein S9
MAKKSLSDLGELTNPKPEPEVAPAPEVAAEAETAAPAAQPAPARESREGPSRGRKGDEAPDDHGVSTQGPQIEAVLREQQLDKQGRAYATGRRQEAVARVWLKPGTGKIVVNGRDQTAYFARPTLRLVINQVFDIAERAGQYDIVATV